MIASISATPDGGLEERRFATIQATMQIAFHCDCSEAPRMVVRVPGDPLMARNNGGMEIYHDTVNGVVVWVKRKQCPTCQKEWIISPTYFGGDVYHAYTYTPAKTANQD